MKLIQAALFYTLAFEVGWLSICSSGASWVVSTVDFPVWAGETDSMWSPDHDSTTGLWWRMVLVQHRRQPSHQISYLIDSQSGEENWHIKMRDLSWPTWNLSFWMDSSQRRTICTCYCWLDVGDLTLFKRFSIYPRLFSTSTQSSSSCKTRLHSTFARILLHLLQVTSTTSFSDIHFSHI